MTDLEQQLAGLSPEQRELFELLHRQQTTNPPGLAGRLPLTFAQQRVWLIEQTTPGNPAYQLSFAFQLHGPLDVFALESALNMVVQRHQALRATIVSEDGMPFQIIAPNLSLRLPVTDLGFLLPAEREAEARRLASLETRKPFDLAAGPLVRGNLLRLDEDDHVFFLTQHHCITDGPSLEIFFDELSAAYCGFRKHGEPQLPRNVIGYAEAVEWERGQAQEGTLAEHLEFWKKQLNGAPSLLNLPTDRPHPAVQTFRGTDYEFVLSAGLSDALRALARREGVTLFMTLLAAFQSLLHRYSQQEEVVVGTATANRNRPGSESVIGFFASSIPLRTSFADDPDFTGLLHRVRDMAIDAYTHEEAPFEKIIEAVKPERLPGRNPVFQHMFILHANAPEDHLALDGMVVSRFVVPGETARMDMTLSISDGQRELRGMFDYNTGVFDAATIGRMAGHFQRLLEGVIANPEERISRLPLTTEEERRTILVEWNATEVDYPANVCLHELIEAQVKRTPDAIAVIFENKKLTYQELNGRANKLAHELRALGVQPETLVGICVERSLEMVIGLLAILKAGGAYVPFDPGYPKERLEFMLTDAKTPVLLAQSHLFARLPAHSARVICLDEYCGASDDNPACGVKPENPAYVIYTSGSTGQPKGAINTHRGICNRLLWMQDAYRLTGADRILQKTPFTFDVSVWEFFWPLMNGSLLVGAKPDLHGDSGYLIRTIRSQGITTMHFVPSMLSAFLTDRDAVKCTSLKRVICSGEALPLETQRHFFQVFPNTELHNLYGPTEASVDVTFWKCEQDLRGYTVPIGRPVANTQIYILDPAMQPVPVGVAGELHIGGVQLARGYLSRPELTAEKFVPNPFGKGRLYKSGDLARFRADGNIEFIGRIDHQVKIRGIRIELDEIESALARHPGVRQCVVIAREDRIGDKRLVAYCALDTTYADATELASVLRRVLPEYMIPSAFVMLDSLPLTANGKIDRRALPAPDYSAAAQGPDTPKTALEEKLTLIWEEILGVQHIGIHANFFELGGDSLSALRIVNNIRASLGGDISLVAIFEAPTIFMLAGLIGRVNSLTENGEPGSGNDSSLTAPITVVPRHARILKRTDA